MFSVPKVLIVVVQCAVGIMVERAVSVGVWRVEWLVCDGMAGDG